MSERCTCFAHEIKCAYRLTAENEKPVNQKKRNQYIIWLNIAFQHFSVLYFAYQSLKIFVAIDLQTTTFETFAK